MQRNIAKIVSAIFHPFFVPTIGYLVLLNSGLYLSMISWEAKRFILLVVFFSTAILPLLSVAIMALSPKFDLKMQNTRDRIVPLLSTAIFYYIGYMLLNKVRIFSAFKLFLIASVIVLIILLLITFKWKISTHMAAIGGMTATLFALSFRSGTNPIPIIVISVILSGLVATSRLILQKHDITQLAAGYFVGFTVLYSAIYFI
jgi:membrane-associated phospholipid phosphatase